MKWSALCLVVLNLALWFVPQWVESERVVQDGAGVLPRVGSLKPAQVSPSVSDQTLTCVSLGDRKSTRLNSSHVKNSYAVFCLKKKRTMQGKDEEVD